MTSHRDDVRPYNTNLALLALAACAFVIGSTEFVVPAVLPEIASGAHVGITTAGLLVSGYALGVVIGAPLVTALLVARRRKPVLLGLLSLSVAGNLISSLAPTYLSLLAGRVVASLCHGAFFGIASLVAIELVPPERRARAIATMFMGITLANLVGVPLGSVLAQHLGWRAPFVALAASGALSLVGVSLFLPPGRESKGRSLRSELRAFRRGQVWLALAMTALGFGAVYCPLTYVVPLITSTAGYPRSAVPWLLALFGAGFTAGNAVGSWGADRHLMTTLIAAIAGSSVVMLVLFGAAHGRATAAVTLFLVGFFAYATVPGFTARVINSAGAAGSTLASSAAVSAFNLGNAVGAYLGGIALSQGHNPADTALAGAGMAVAALAVATVSAFLDRPKLPSASRPFSASEK